MILNITIVNVNTCGVVPLAAVDVWHCDATGLYSHFHVQGNLADANSTFLRGIQFTDTDGVATIRTIVPAYYSGRATHIHFKVHINGTTTDGGIFFSCSQKIDIFLKHTAADTPLTLVNCSSMIPFWTVSMEAILLATVSKELELLWLTIIFLVKQTMEL